VNIRIIAVGKLKEKYLIQGTTEYLKRLQAYAKIEVCEVREESFMEPLNRRQIEIIKDKEADRIWTLIPERYYIISLDRGGKQLSSVQLAKKLEALAVYQQGNVVFIIGGPLGLAESLIGQSDFVLSFSRLTFPHQLMRIVLMEQIYRSMTIIRNEKYHK